jgi:hypothetical protein
VLGTGEGNVGPIPPTVNPENLDYGNKVMHCAWHPNVNAIAVAGANNLFLCAFLYYKWVCAHPKQMLKPSTTPPRQPQAPRPSRNVYDFHFY